MARLLPPSHTHYTLKENSNEENIYNVCVCGGGFNQTWVLHKTACFMCNYLNEKIKGFPTDMIIALRGSALMHSV